MKLTRRTFLKNSSVTFAALPFMTDRPVQYGIFQQVRNKKNYTVPTVCNMCRARCLLVCEVQGKRLVGVSGNPKNPFNGEKVCARAKAAAMLVNDPDRLKYPYKRVGKRGEGKWARIEWGEAIDTIAMHIEKSLDRYGPESLSLFAKGPSSTYVRELFEELAVPHINDPEIEQCGSARDVGFGLTFGNAPGHAVRPDYANTECIFLLGSHIGENVQVPEVKALIDARANGAKLIVVDPRVSVIASKADLHLMIRPGTDTALLLGLINFIIANDLYHTDFITAHALGFAELREHAARYPLERVSWLTDIPVDQLIRAAGLLSSHAPATVIHPGGHTAWSGDDVQRVRAQAVLAGLLGSWGNKGGLLAPSGLSSGSGEETGIPTDFLLDRRRHSSVMLKKALKGETKVLGCWGQNPFHAYPNPYRTAAAFKKAKFVFACDVLPTEPSLYADIILPETTFFERSDILETWSDDERTVVASRYAVVSPRFDVKDPYWIVKHVSDRLGRGKGFHYKNVLERLNEQLAGYGLTIDELFLMGGVAVFSNTVQARENVSEPAPAAIDAPPEIREDAAMDEIDADEVFQNMDRFFPEPKISDVTFATPSGKIEFYSRQLKELGLSPLPEYSPPTLPPSGYARLLSGKSPVHTGSSTMNNQWLLREAGEGEIWVNTQAAGKMGVSDGEELFLENQDGIRSKRPVRLKVTPGIRSDCVYMVHGFGSASSHLRKGYNRGVSDTSLMLRGSSDPLTGARGTRLNFVRFFKNGRPLDFPALDTPHEELQQAPLWREDRKFFENDA